jgi:hypothetical protein
MALEFLQSADGSFGTGDIVVHILELVHEQVSWHQIEFAHIRR